MANGVAYFGGGDGVVYALNASTGALLWSYATNAYLYSSPAVANGVVYIGSEDGNVYALNAITGAKLWSYYTNTVGWCSPAVANGVVYIACGDEWGGLFRVERRQRVRLRPELEPGAK